MQKISALLLFACLMSGCAVLHHAQIGNIDNRNGIQKTPFTVMVSETGVSTEDISRIAKATNSKAGDSASSLAEIVALFQMGPRTGNPTYNPKYAEKLLQEIYKQCPSGKITGLMSIRETRKYPVISGEIVKITGYCMTDSRATQTTSSESDFENIKGNI